MASERMLLLAEIPHLRRYARVLAGDAQAEEDLVQSCLERALAKLHLWRRDLPMRPWLLAIMHNLYVGSVRRRFHGPVFEPLSDFDHPTQPADQDVHLNTRRVLAAIDRLSEDQRLAVQLVAVEELTYKEAAEVLGVPIGTLMSRLHRGRERLRDLLGMIATADASHPNRPRNGG